MNDLPLLCTIAQARDEYRVRDAGRRIRRWVSDGRLHQAGIYQPPGGQVPVELFLLSRVLALAEGTTT